MKGVVIQLAFLSAVVLASNIRFGPALTVSISSSSSTTLLLKYEDMWYVSLYRAVKNFAHYIVI